jgi:hypothetical protein
VKYHVLALFPHLQQLGLHVAHAFLAAAQPFLELQHVLCLCAELLVLLTEGLHFALNS